MGNIVIASPALSDAATLSTPGTVAATLPLANLQAMYPGQVCRFTSLAGMAIVADLGAPYAINLVALVMHSATAAASWRIRGASSQANLTAAPGYDSGTVSLWPSSGQPSGWPKATSSLFLAGAQTYEWWRIDLADAANPAGYLDIGRLYLAAAWQPSRNHKTDWSLAYVDDTLVTKSLSGINFVTPRPPRRKVDWTIEFLSETEMKENALELDRLRGASKDVLAIRDPGATTELQHDTVQGLQTLQPVTIGAPSPVLWSKKFTIEELIP